MTDNLRKLLAEQEARLNQKFSADREKREKESENEIRLEEWIGVSSSDGRGITKDPLSDNYNRGNVITSGQIAIGQRVLRLTANDNNSSINAMPTNYGRQDRRRYYPIIERGKIAILAEVIYEGEPIPCSCLPPSQEGLSFLSILYSTINENAPAECACTKKWKRVGNRCYPICRDISGNGIYESLEACQAAPEPDWPDPTGQNNGRGGGGYWKVWVGYKRIITGQSAPTDWTGGTFYESLTDLCFDSILDRVSHYTPRSNVVGKPGEFPASLYISGFFEYFSLPMVPRIDRVAYQTSVILSGFKNTSSSSGAYRSNSDGWFLFASFNNDVYLLEEERWLNPDDVSFGFCAVGKYVRVEDGDIQPPSSIDGFNCSGVTIFCNPMADECSPFGNRSDPTCLDPGRGQPVRGCPFPQDRRAYQVWVGGSRENPIEVSRVHIDDNYDGYIVANGLSGTTLTNNEIIRVFSKAESDNDWCKIETIELNGIDITKTKSKNPEIPPSKDDWRQSTAVYNQLAPNSLGNNFLSGIPAIDAYRGDKQANIIIPGESKTLVYTNLEQKIFDIEQNQVKTFNDVIKKRNLIDEVSICVSPFIGETSDKLLGKGWVIDSVYKIHDSPIKILGASAWIGEVGKFYESEKLSCDRTIKWYCDKLLLIGDGTGANNAPLSISITIKPSRSFNGGGQVEVWRTNSNSPSVLDRIWVGKSESTNGSVELKFPLSMPWYDGMFFICRNPAKDNMNDTCIITWDFPSLTVTLEEF